MRLLANFKISAAEFKVKLSNANMVSAKFSLWLLWIREIESVKEIEPRVNCSESSSNDLNCYSLMLTH